MSERARSLIFVAIIVVFTVVLGLTISTTSAVESRALQIGARIKCPVCQGEAIADSPAQMARDMMDLVEERVAEGASDAEIEQELLTSYSGAVLLDPPFEGRTIALWLTPLVAALVGGIVIIRWQRQTPPDTAPARGETSPRSRSRLLLGSAILAVALAGIVAVAANSLQQRDGPNAGVADIGDQDLTQVSNETLEAVIAANADHPQINGMRLALAERYFESGAYRDAFPQYLAVADSSLATSAELVTSLVRLGWMAYDGNGETGTAVSLFDEALEVDPDSQAALYLKGTVLWCGESDDETAAALFTELLGDPELPDDSRERIEADLASIAAGDRCL